MRGGFSLVLVHLIGITCAAITGNDVGYESVLEKPEYYPKPETFGKQSDPAFTQYQDRLGNPQDFDFKAAQQSQQFNRYQAPQLQPFNRFQAPQPQQYNRFQVPQPQTAGYAQQQAPSYNRYQTPQIDPEYAKQYFNFAQLQRQEHEKQMAAYYKELKKTKAAESVAAAVEAALPEAKPQGPIHRSFCPGKCPKWCLPKCNVECCNPKPPPMPEYLQIKQNTAYACEGHKLKIRCPNRSERIIMYSSFYGREKDGNSTCHHDVLPSKGTCNDQEHHVNEKVYDLCGHENRCEVAVDNKFLAKDNTTICPGVYKYLKVIYKCSQHPKIFKICPLPCKNPQNCFPSCKRDCCAPTPKPKPAPVVKIVAPPQPPQSCPAPCPATCKPPCTPQCCYGNMQRDEIAPYFRRQPKPQPQPQPQAQQLAANMYGQQPYNSPSYYANPNYPSNTALQNPFTSYKQYNLRSSCPAACSQMCSVNCPPECCGAQQPQQYGKRVVNYYG